jgi:tetratricopeptide (TPR) repeat protein
VHTERLEKHRAIMAVDLLISVAAIIGALIAFFGIRGLRDIRRVALRIRAARDKADEELRTLPAVDITSEISPDLKTTLAELGRRLDMLEELGQPLEAGDLIARGNAWYSQGDYMRAASWYERAIAAKPGLADGHYRRGIALYQLGQYEDALASLARVIELSPDDAEAAYVKGLVLRQLGRYEDAVSSYSRAITLSPGWPRPYLGRAAVHALLGRTQESLADLASLVEVDRGSRDAIESSPDFEGLRDNPEYRRLVGTPAVTRLTEDN